MAKASHPQKDRPSGWSSEGSHRVHFRPLPSDDLILAVLWILVVVGLLLLALFLIPTLSSRTDAQLGVTTAYAKTVTDSRSATALANEEAPAPLSPQSQPQEKNISSEVEVSQGTVLEASIHSDTLGMDLPYRIYLPPGYNSSQQRYPVLYLLHGVAGNFAEWTEGNRLGLIADPMISEGRVRPMIIVMPDGSGSYFMNWANGGPRWADYVVNDVVPFIDSHYRTLANREHRAIGGMSMGAHAALQLAFNHPDMFSIVGANSPALFLPGDEMPAYFGDWNYYATYDPIRLAATKSNLNSLQIWLDVSEQDQHLDAVKQLHDAMVARGLDLQWHEFTGVHFSSYWIEHTPEYMDFYSAAFDKNH